MSLFEFILLIFASMAALECWFRGSLFAGIHEKLEKKEGLVADLLSCPFCLSYHIPFWLLVISVVLPILIQSPFMILAKLPMYSLAITFFVQRFTNVKVI